MSRRVVLVYNTMSYLVRFRAELIEALASRGYGVIALAPVDASQQTLERLGARCVPLSLERYSANPFTEIASFAAIVRTLWRSRPCIVLSFTIKPVIYASLAGRFIGGVQTHSMITGRGSVFLDGSRRGRLRRRVVEALYRIALADNGRVFFQNNADSAYFVAKRLVRPEQVSVVPGSGVNLERFRAPAREPADPAFIMVARLLREKGVAEFVQAARRLAARHPSACFRLVGPFDDNPSALRREELLALLGDGPVEYLGEVGDVREALGCAWVFVLPSYYAEGTPRSILEALAMGMPVVTTDTPGCRETVDEGHNGFVVPARNVPRLAEAMERFLLDPSLAQSMGRRSRQIAAERYDVRVINAGIMDAMGITDNGA
ncbi:MAG: glycosyltransferase family 4 protein [Gammaproteobacteria bacterium]|nr:glycosyltransferase family 4 protein [Gammaproteobacteria bacterium]